MTQNVQYMYIVHAHRFHKLELSERINMIVKKIIQILNYPEIVTHWALYGSHMELLEHLHLSCSSFYPPMFSPECRSNRGRHNELCPGTQQKVCCPSP